MSAILTTCCCDPDPDPLTCCDCLASSYSIALDMAWTTSADDTSGNFGTVDVAFTYSGWVVTAQECETLVTDPPGQYKISPFNSSSGLITGADVSLSFSGSPLTCVDRSISGATLDSPGITLGFSCLSDYNDALGCHHFRKADNSVVYQWFHAMNFTSQTTCASGFSTAFKGCIIAEATEQASCHAPPSTGWTVTKGNIYYCLDINGANDRCFALDYAAATTTSKTFSMTVT